MKKLKYKIKTSTERGGRRCSYENNSLDNCHGKEGWRAVFAVLERVLHDARTQ